MGYNTAINLRKILCEGVIWIQPAQDTIQCRGPVNTVINLQCPIKGGQHSDDLKDHQILNDASDPRNMYVTMLRFSLKGKGTCRNLVHATRISLTHKFDETTETQAACVNRCLQIRFADTCRDSFSKFLT